jgi:hypothetical protein
MPLYGASGQSANSTSNDRTALCLTQGGTLCRPAIVEFAVGFSSTPIDAIIRFRVQRTTAAGTGASSPPTPEPLDADDRAALGVITHAHPTTDPTYAGASPFTMPLHVRNLFRWVARPRGELVIKAAANAGYGIKKLSESNGVVLDAVLHWNE